MIGHYLACELCYQRGKYRAALADSNYCADCTNEIDSLLADVKSDMAKAGEKSFDDFDTQVHSDELRDI